MRSDKSENLIELLAVGLNLQDVGQISEQATGRFNVTAVDVDGALKALRKPKYSVVAICDNCGETEKIIRFALDSNPLLPIIVCVDVGCSGERELAILNGGAKYVLRQPLDAGVFIAVANNLLRNYLQHRSRATVMHKIGSAKELLQSILDNNSDIIFVRDVDGEFIKTNRAFEHFFDEPITQDLFLSSFHGESVQVFQASEKKVFDEGKVAEVKVSMSSGMGIRQFNARMFPLYDQSCRIYGVCTIAVDITERMKLEEDMRVMSLFPDANPNLLMRVDLSGNVIYKNPATKEWLKQEKLGDIGIYHLLPEDFTAILHGAVTEQRTVKSQVVYGDQFFEFKLTPFKELDSCLVMLADVTELETAKRESEIYYQAFGVANQGVIILDAKGEVTQVNSAFLRIFSASLLDVLGGTINDFIPDKVYCLNLGISSEEYDAIFEDMKNGLADLEISSWEGDVPALDANKHIIWIHLFISVVRDADGEPIAYVGMPADVTERLDEEKKIRLECYRALAELAETRDNETGEHLTRMGEYCAAMAAYCGLPQKYIDDLRTFAPLHDVGKVGIPDSILLAERKLTDEEFDIMKSHTSMGHEILEGKPTLEMAADIAHYHHEKWNGLGYPEGLRGEEIPLCARILAIADVYDALRSKRPYKMPWSHEKAAEIIYKDSGVHFDPALVEVFEALEPKFEALGDAAAE